MTDVTALLERPQRTGVVRTVLDNNPGMEPDMAERVVDEALKFTASCAAFPDARLRPSRVVDEGWHALILHTRVYEQLCSRLGRFVDHAPDQPGSTSGRSEALDETQTLMVEAGFAPDRTLWLQSAGCAECNGGPAPCCEYCDPNKKEE